MQRAWGNMPGSDVRQRTASAGGRALRGVGRPGQRVQVNGFDWDAPHRAPRSISWTEQWHFGAGSHNRCGSRSSEHIQKRQRDPPPSRSVNLSSLPWLNGEVIARTVQTGFDPETGAAVYENEIMDLAP